MAPSDHGLGGAPLVPDLVEVDVATGGRVIVVSDLHLARETTAASVAAATELAQTVESWTGPGLVVLAGDCFELLEGSNADPRPALQSHGRLTSALAAFSRREGRRILCLPGNHDGRLAWDANAVRGITELTGAEMALAVELHISTGSRVRDVRIEHGHQLDPANTFTDPRNPLDTPLGHHLVRDLLPSLDASPGGSTWLTGIEELADPFAFPRFLASRLAYRRLGRHAWWLVLPFLLAVILKVPLSYTLTRWTGVSEWSHRLMVIGIGAVLDVFFMALVAAIAVRRTWRAFSGVALSSRGLQQNDAARDRARTLVSAGGAGLITGHTHHPELTHLGEGFYANTGCGTVVIDECPARLGSLGLPPVFLSHRELSWVELEAGAELHVRLLHARVDLPDGTVLERAMARRVKAFDPRPTVVATFPHGESWPPAVDPAPALRRTRRIAASLIALAGLFDLASAFYPPYRSRLTAVLRLVPLAVPQAATALVAVAGLALLLLARGVRRGHRLAWIVSVALLEGSAVLHLVKGVDLEEAIVALIAAGYLLIQRRAFQSGIDHPSLRRGVLTLVSGLAVVTVVSVAMVELATALHGRGGRVAFGTALLAVLERLIGITHVTLPDRLDDFITPALTAVGVGLGVYAVYLALRPVVTRRRAAGADAGLVKARAIVADHGSSTLDYFALRSDKEAFFDGDSLVAYAVYGAVCLVSPDPIGPPSERDRVWAAFRRFADDHGWILAVMGAGEEWLPTYRAAGMFDLYVGDEAVVDINRFSLEGGKNKGLRQAVNRIAKYGYTISFHDPATADAQLRAGVEAIMTKSRRGDVERGFSMTLGRIFDPDDKGMLLAVASDAEGHPVAFCQYVPAPGIDGYSLDLMRRDDGEHPNGLLDFVVVETIKELRRRNMRGLGLNFATMRAVLAGEAGDSLTQRVERWLLRRMSDSMQIESLWRFNAKFDPDWQPRYAVYDAPEHALAAAIAVARAESFWELPVIGRFLRPDRPDAVDADAAAVTASTTSKPRPEDEPADAKVR
jgi:lysylphosphatidylglycerol synthetase-like protein (DUF2156 family)/UDP-2,3-diacylglucosamine pyrophosphatase LpxH